MLGWGALSAGQLQHGCCQLLPAAAACHPAAAMGLAPLPAGTAGTHPMSLLSIQGIVSAALAESAQAATGGLAEELSGKSNGPGIMAH